MNDRISARALTPRNRRCGFAWLVLSGLLASGCAQLPPAKMQPVEPAFDQPQTTRLGQLAGVAASTRAGQSGFVILDTGRQAFLHRAALIEAAERSIDAQYYIWNSDLSGRYLARRLLLAADRGVRVRLLLDDINVGDRDAVLAALDHHPNVSIRIYNPFATRAGPGKWLSFLGEFQRLNRRMHNKTFVVDAAFGIVGGRNIGDEYFDLHAVASFRDRDLLAAGPVVGDMSANFDAYWNNAWAYPIEVLAPDGSDQDAEQQLARARALAGDTSGLTQTPALEAGAGLSAAESALSAAIWAPAELVFDAPAQDMREATDAPRATARALSALIDETRQEILAESAYFILGDAQLDGVARLRDRGVRVAVLTNSLASNDLTTNHAGYARRRTAMLERGLELHELRPDAAACANWVEHTDFCGHGAVSLHAKSVVFDRRTLYVGSFNINLRSIYLNGETVLIVHSRQLAQRVAADIETALAPANSWRVLRTADGGLQWSAAGASEWRHEPATGWWRRFKSAVFAMFPMEKYL